MAENKLADLSTEFAVKILELTENIKGHCMKETAFVYRTKAVSFQRNKSLPGFVKFASQVKYACGT